MSTYEVGSLCKDCLSNGQNYLKPFSSFEEQIIKCESCKCMFPFLRKRISYPSQDPQPSESVLSLEESIKESAQKEDVTSIKSEQIDERIEESSNKTEEVPIMNDYSSLFLAFSVTKVDKRKTTQQTAPTTCQAEDTKSSTSTSGEVVLPQSQTPSIAKISRCLSNVKSRSKKAKLERAKLKRGKHNPVFVIDPQSGKPMRPLDLIKHYQNIKSDQKLLNDVEIKEERIIDDDVDIKKERIDDLRIEIKRERIDDDVDIKREGIDNVDIKREGIDDVDIEEERIDDVGIKREI